MSTIPVVPPGEVVEFADDVADRFAEPATNNLHVIGVCDRGSVGQAADISTFRSLFGGHSNSSPAPDEVASALGQTRDTTATFSRILGPDAHAATKAFGDIIVTASSEGAWGNQIAGRIVADGTLRRLELAISGTPIPIQSQRFESPWFSANTELLGWSGGGHVTITLDGDDLPPASSDWLDLVLGTDDRSNISTSNIESALSLLDRRYGPGHLIAPGITTVDGHLALLESAAAANRLAYATLPADVTESQALAHAQSVADASPDDAWRLSLWGSWGWCSPIAGEPERAVGYAGLQAGIASRVELTDGLGAAPFGLRRGQALGVSRLYREWTSSPRTPAGEIQRLYAGNVNVAYDNGRAIYSKGYVAADGSDLHVSGTRMRLAFRAERAAEQYAGEPCDMGTVGQYCADLIAICQEFARARAFNTDRGPGFVVDGSTINTPASLAARQLGAVIRFRPAGSVHWVSALVGTVRPTEVTV